jgi:hypothetical protein
MSCHDRPQACHTWASCPLRRCRRTRLAAGGGD